MKNQRDKLQQYQKRITAITDRETAIAKSCLAKGDKPRALLALRRKKYQESLLTKSDEQLATLEQLTANVEFALVQKDILFGLKQGTSVLKQINAEMGGIDSVEKLMGENEEAKDYQRQVSEMLEGGLSRNDEEDVEEELELLEKGMQKPETRVDERSQTAAKVEQLPDAPKTTPIFAEELKDRARRKDMRRDRILADALEPMSA